MHDAFRFLLGSDDVLRHPAAWAPISRETATMLASSRPVVVLSPAGSATWFDEESPYLSGRSSAPLGALRYFVYRSAPPSLALVQQVAREREDEPAEAAVETTEHFVEFVFEYTDRVPVSGLSYVLTKPDGSKEKGKLGDDGTISKKGVPVGTYTVAIAQIEVVAWQIRRVKAGEEAVLEARLSGVPDGTPAKIRVFRELAETDDDVLATLSATVTADRVEARWTYDYLATTESKGEMGVARFVAELSIDDGAQWAKTVLPLSVELPTIDRIDWSRDRAAAGDVVEMVLTTSGFADGTSVAFTVKRHALSTDDEPLGDATAVVEGGKAIARFLYGKGGSADVASELSGEHFFVAKIESPVERMDRSGYLWCMVADDEGATDEERGAG